MKKVTRKKQRTTSVTNKAPQRAGLTRIRITTPQKTIRVQRAKNDGSKRLPLFWIGLLVYIVILLVLAGRFLAYTDRCLVAYEQAQSDRAMDTYMENFVSEVAESRVPASMDLTYGSGRFEDENIYQNLYLDFLKEVRDFTYEKDEGSYLTEEPVYDIFADGTLVARITWNGVNARTIFGILTIMDWEVQQAEAVFTADTKDYTIWVPDQYQVTVNGVTLTEQDLTGNKEEHPELSYAKLYVDIPEIVEYKVSELFNAPEICIYDASGEPVDYEQDEDGSIVLTYNCEEQAPEAYEETALIIAKTWDSFLTDELGGTAHGLDVVRQYLLQDSYYWSIATDYAYGVDISFISPHTLPETPYDHVQVTDFTLYTGACFSCHVYFEKSMYLTVTGQTKVNTIDSTFYFVWYDDSDDGVDNPHWSIVNMESGSAQ